MNKNKRSAFLRAVPCALLSLAAICWESVPLQAQVTFDLGTFITDDDPLSGDIALSIPAGNYNYYSFTTDWSAISGDPYSSEAIWAITDGPLSSPGTTFYADPGPAPNSQDNSNPITLQWEGFTDFTINGPLDGILLTLQAFEGSSAQWANTMLALSFQTAPPNFIDLGVIANIGELVVVDTFGSEFDTELGVFDQVGSLLGSNDDSVGTFQSLLEFPAGLAAGNYYVALGGFNTDYSDNFGATGGNESGNWIVNANIASEGGLLAPGQIQWLRFQVVPEPGSLVLIAGGLVLSLLARRRPFVRVLPSERRVPPIVAPHPLHHE